MECASLIALFKFDILLCMSTSNISWPHAPEHRLIERGTYIVTCGTYQKQHFLNTPAKLTLVRNLLFELALKHGWQLQAWAIMSNHYHFVASSPDDPSSLIKMLSTLHTLFGPPHSRHPPLECARLRAL